MRHRLSENTPASMPERINASARLATKSIRRTASISFLPDHVDDDLLHSPLVDRFGGEAQTTKMDRLARARHYLGLCKHQPAHRQHARDFAQRRIFPSEVLQRRGAGDAPLARADLFN